VKRGKLIVLYGVNNLGKTTQAKILVEELRKAGLRAEYLKYPIYNLKPTGPLLNDYLRGGNPQNLTPKQAQELYAQNRSDYRDALTSKLKQGINIVAEDYWGTGAAWGLGRGVEKKFLLELNKPFQNEDLAILLDGKRFVSGVEEGHLHEQNEELTGAVQRAHLELAKGFGWKTVNANQAVEKVAQDIRRYVKEVIK